MRHVDNTKAPPKNDIAVSSGPSPNLQRPIEITSVSGSMCYVVNFFHHVETKAQIPQSIICIMIFLI